MLPIRITSGSITQLKQTILVKRFVKTIVLIVDERSMLEAANLALMQHYMKICAHGGVKSNKPWGGIPIVILVGDDYQLPPIECGAIYSLSNSEVPPKKSSQTDSYIGFRQSGFTEFRELGKNVMYLKGEKRVIEGQQQFRRILRAVRCENVDEEMNDEDTQQLLNLNFDVLSSHEQQLIENDGAMFVCAYKKDKDHINEIKLKMANLQGNPVARWNATTTTTTGRIVVNESHYDSERSPHRGMLCVGAKVALNGWNAAPEMGLYHGSVGKVVDIVYRVNESPNLDDWPSYVLVEFEHYCGPLFLKEMPKVVPITPITFVCRRHCCSHKYLPLALSWSKTAHTIQGLSVGPVPPGRPKNAINKIIVNPGKRVFEGNNVGLLYTLLSRVTTIGNLLDILSSAIYFTGEYFTLKRISKLTLAENKAPYKKAELREKWVNYLKKHERKNSGLTNRARQILFEWTLRTRIKPSELYEIIQL